MRLSEFWAELRSNGELSRQKGSNKTKNVIRRWKEQRRIEALSENASFEATTESTE